MPLFFFFLFLSLTHLSHVFATNEAVFDCACRTGLAKPTVGSIGSLNALVIFAKFKGEATGADQAPSWGKDLFDRRHPGSFAHFYDEMSGGLLQLGGQVLPKRYSSLQPAAAYLADVPGALGRFGQFNLEILEQADRDIDVGLFDNDGPDGLPNSGDDDGYVDIVFINLLTVPKDFLVGTATGLASLVSSASAAVSPVSAAPPSAATCSASPRGLCVTNLVISWGWWICSIRVR